MMRSILLLLVALCCPGCAGCTYVPPGYVGIKVNSYGHQRGPEDFPVSTGRVWFNPFTETVYTFPTYMQNRAWTAERTEGSPVDEAITFNSVEGAQISADVGLNYSLDGEQVPSLFVKHRQTIDHITDTYLRNQVRDAFNRVAGNYKAVEIFGSSKQAVLDAVKVELEHRLEGQAFVIDNVSFIGSPRGDNQVMQSINQVIEATQQAVRAEAMVRQKTAEAEQAVAAAKGEAEAILAVAEAQAQANQKIAESVTPSLIHYKLLEKWDGVAPRVMGGDAGQLLFQIDAK